MNNFFRSGSSGGGRFSFFPPVIKWLLGLNIGIFALESLFGSLRFGGVPIGYYLQYLYLFPLNSGAFFPTQLFTYMFMHAGLSHILFNMLALWMFGMQLEQAWGSKKFLTFYVLCGLGGGIAHLIMSPILTDGMIGAPLVGASGAIFGLLIGFGLLYPEQPIYLYFFFPIKAKYFVALYMGLEVMFLSNGSSDGVSHLAHLGGAVVGIVYMLVSVGAPTIISNFRSSRSRKEPKSNIWQQRGQGGGMFHRPERDDDVIDAEYQDVGTATATRKTDSRGMRVITQADIDIILDKIADKGYQNLSEEEREILFEASRKMDERGRA